MNETAPVQKQDIDRVVLILERISRQLLELKALLTPEGDRP